MDFPTAAYPGHDLIDLLNLNVPGSTEGISVVAAIQLAGQAFLNLTQLYVSDGNGNYITEEEAIAQGATLDESGEFYLSQDGDVLDIKIGAFKYKGVWFSSEDMIEVDGVLYVRTDLFSENGEFENVPVGITNAAVVNAFYDLYAQSGNQLCFAAGTPVRLWDGTSKHIEDITCDDVVLSFDQAGNRQPGIVSRLFRNSTEEWVRLGFDDGRDPIYVTPGHRFFTEFGDYREIGHSTNHCRTVRLHKLCSFLKT